MLLLPCLRDRALVLGCEFGSFAAVVIVLECHGSCCVATVKDSKWKVPTQTFGSCRQYSLQHLGITVVSQEQSSSSSNQHQQPSSGSRSSSSSNNNNNNSNNNYSSFIPTRTQSARVQRSHSARSCTPALWRKGSGSVPQRESKKLCDAKNVLQLRFGAKALDGQSPNYGGGNRGGSDITHLYTEVWCNASQEACMKARATDHGSPQSMLQRSTVAQCHGEVTSFHDIRVEAPQALHKP